MSVSSSYISIGANRSSSCAATCSSGILAYGAGHTIALWDYSSSSRGVFATLLGHTAHVTTVKLLREQPGRATFVSGDGAGQIRIWEQEEGQRFRCTHNFTAHSGSSISAIGILPSKEDTFDILTGGSDGTLKRWNLATSPGSKAKEVQRLDVGGRLPLDLDVALLPGSTQPVLVIGLTHRDVQVWTVSNGEFKRAISLEGHEDWVRCVSLTSYPSNSPNGGEDLLLATGAQDNYIRLWRIAPAVALPADNVDDLLEEFERRMGGEDGHAQLSTKAHVLSVEDAGTKRYDVTLEALLVGHESGLTNVHWSPTPASSSSSSSPSSILLSTAADNSLVIWCPSVSETHHSRDGIWVPEQRFGAFGGRGLSFYGAVWGPKGDTVIATGWTGGVERWTRNAEGAWLPASGITGHFGAAQSVEWDPRGDYIVSTGSDQTSRIHAECHPSSSNGRSGVWAEIARPQIHGYDLVDGTFVSPFRLASVSEEKVVRVFDATEGFASSLHGLGVREGVSAGEASLPKGATVPPLSLSNRALGKELDALAIPKLHIANEARDSVSAALTSLPTEEELNTSTLWPEIEKVYGHGYELSTLAASHSGDLIATASRASSAEHATIRLTSTATWGPVGSPLAGHSLTVTRVAFSPDDKYLLSVSRDRGWRLFAREASGAFAPFAAEERAHSRMVLDCAWSSSGNLFATAGRDKVVKIWKLPSDKNKAVELVHTLKFAEPVTAIALRKAGAGDILAVGTESGALEIHTLSPAGEAKKALDIPPELFHAAAVNRLAWRLSLDSAEGAYVLASAGEDRAVRVFTVSL